MPTSEWIEEADPWEGSEEAEPPPFGSASLSLCQFTKTAMLLPDGLGFDVWQQIGATLKGIERSIHFWIGDWLAYGERTYGETYAQASEATGYAVKTLQNDVYVAQAVEPSRRRESLTHAHHSAVAALTAAQQDAILSRADAESLTVDETRRAALRARATAGSVPGPMYRVHVRKSLQNEYCAAETPSSVEAMDDALGIVRECLMTGTRAIIDVLTCQGQMEPQLYRRVVTGFKE